MKGCVFRSPKMSDLDEFYDCYESVVNERKYFKFIDAPSKTLLAKYLEKAVNRKSAFLVAEVDGKFVGWAEISFRDSFATEYNGQLVIAIMSGYRGKGIGKILLQMIIALGRQIQLKYLRSDVFSNNTRAIECFKKFGFQVDGVRPEYVVINGSALDITYLSRKL